MRVADAVEAFYCAGFSRFLLYGSHLFTDLMMRNVLKEAEVDCMRQHLIGVRMLVSRRARQERCGKLGRRSSVHQRTKRGIRKPFRRHAAKAERLSTCVARVAVRRGMAILQLRSKVRSRCCPETPPREITSLHERRVCALQSLILTRLTSVTCV